MPPCALKCTDFQAEAELSPGELLCTSGRGSGSSPGPQQEVGWLVLWLIRQQQLCWVS